MDISNTELDVKVENNPRQLNSENLISFLRGIDDGGEITVDLDKDEFPSGLRLSWAKDYLNEMYANQKRGKHLPEDVQKEIRVKAGQFRNLSGNRVFQRLADVLEQQAGEEGLLESSRNIYCHFRDNAVRATEIIYGGGFSVKNTVYDAYQLGFPLLDVHTHPESQLPTVNDFAGLMMTFDDGRRVLNGIVVLCPEGQALALATKDTPRFERWTKAFDLIEEIKGEQEGERRDEAEGYNVKKREILKKFAETVVAEGHLVEEAKKRGDEKDTVEAKERIMKTMKNTQKEMTSVVGLETDKMAKVINQQGVANANRLGICLYWSTDCENFRKFSA